MWIVRLTPALISEPTKLFPTKNKVEQINIAKMAALCSDIVEFKIKYINNIKNPKFDRNKCVEFTEKDINLNKF